MKDELIATTDETEVIIAYLEWPDGRDDWPPIYAAMYPMLHAVPTAMPWKRRMRIVAAWIPTSQRSGEP